MSPVKAAFGLPIQYCTLIHSYAKQKVYYVQEGNPLFHYVLKYIIRRFHTLNLSDLFLGRESSLFRKNSLLIYTFQNYGYCETGEIITDKC
jgi:hypothetical protein